MHFTREPIVQTVVTPREGFKLVIRNSKTSGVEEYFVDAVEIISFGEALFFRSLERPKQFLLPVTDYEVVEVRETRMVLKTAAKKEAKVEETEPTKKRRQRRRRTQKEPPVEEPVKVEKREEIAPPKTLLPPPTSLISENIDRYKEVMKEGEAPIVAPSAPTGETSDKGAFSAAKFLRRLTGREEE